MKKTRLRFPILKKMMKDLLREKTFVFAVLIQVLLILSIYVLLGFSSLFFAPQYFLVNKSVAVVGPEIAPYVNSSRLSVAVFNDPAEALISFEEGVVDAVIVEESAQIPKNYTVYLPDSQLQTTILLSVLKEGFEAYEDDMRNSLVEADSVPLKQIRTIGRFRQGSDYIFELLYGMMIPFLLIVPVFLVGSLVIDNVCEEIEKKTLTVLLIATSFRRVFHEIVLGAVIILLMQLAAWMLFLHIQHITLARMEEIVVYLVLFSTFVCLVGVLLSITLRAKTRAQLIYSVVVLATSSTSAATPVSPVSVISRLGLGIEEVGYMPYLILLVLIAATYVLIIRKGE